MEGKRVSCPKCQTQVEVPRAQPMPPLSEDADAWLDLDGDLNSHEKAASEPPSAPSPTEAAPPVRLGPSVFDDDLPDLAPLPQTQPSSALPPGLSAALDQLSNDGAVLSSYFQAPPSDEEFSFPCKVCGTLLYSSTSRIGSMIRCPDCHSEFSVPSPPVKKKPPKFELDDAVADVRLSPVDGPNPRTPTSSTDKTKELLDKAAVEAERERQELESIALAFDTKRWLSMIFGFLRDPGVVFLTIALGICAAVCFYALHAVGGFEMSPIQIWMLRAVLFALFGIPIFVSILLCAVVILPMAANRSPRIEEWPFGRFGEAMSEGSMGVAAIAVSVIPGGILATLLTWVSAPTILSEVIVLTSVWGLTPILLLSMIDNNRITEPFSKSIWQTLTARPDAWGAMYMQTAMTIIGLFLLYALAIVSGPMNSAMFGLMLPLGLFFIANQYGILAGRLSDITRLGYSGDFSDDNPDAKEDAA